MATATRQPTPAAGPLDRIEAAYRARHGSPPRLLARAPGRLTLLGAHVDHSEGWVLPVAIEPAVYLAAGFRDDRRLDLVAADLGDRVDLDLARLPPPVPQRQGRSAAWSDYAAGVAWALAEGGWVPAGLNAVIGGDLPMAGGLSSSAAFEAALILAWEELSGFRLAPLDRARVGHRAEGGYLGLGSGIMDQYVVLHAEPGAALFLDCRSLVHESIDLPPGLALVVADSGVERRLVGSGFNSRRRECERAVELLRPELPGIDTLRDVDAAALDELAALLPPAVARRARHVVGECRRARQGAAALRAGDAAELGRLMRRSHESSRDLYEVSLPELDTLARAAWEAPGCLGARFSGGGFGGCVGALVEAGAEDVVREAMASAFLDRFGRRPSSFATGAAGAASLLEGAREPRTDPAAGC